MTTAAQRLLRDTYGYSAFRDRQQAVIESAMAGRDSLVLMPTGGGKSLCYQIPSMLREGVGLVVSPLIALMQDQVAALRQLGVRAAFLNSSLSPSQQTQVVRQLRDASLDILYISPERLLQAATLDTLAACPVSLIAIDEAHCVSQWGHDFRQDYLSLHVLRDRFPGVPRMALTATADHRTREEIIDRLCLDQPQRFVSGFDRPNICYTVQAKTDARSQLLKFLADRRDEAGIVYCMSRAKTENTAGWLHERGFTALPYHAGLPSAVRNEHQTRFVREDGVIIVATIAFGMGIDKPDVRFVAHLDLPKSIEAYYQETGRAGRDGEPSEAWMVYGLQDVVRLRQMVDASVAGEDRKRVERHKLDALLGWCEITECRRRALLAYFGDTQVQDCGNCDVCLRPPKTWDATIAAQQLLSTVYRTGQRFGPAHVIDVVRGKPSDKTRQHRHETLSTFGIGADRSAHQWRSVTRQLLVQGFLKADVEHFGGLALTEQSRRLLRGEMTLYLREDLAEPAPRKEKHRAQTPVAEEHQALWETLRQCRKRLADEQGVPPYVIFHDATLSAMIQYHPKTEAELLEISGVGQAKLARYGAQFLAALNGEAA